MQSQTKVENKPRILTSTLQSIYYDDRGQTHPDLVADARLHSRKGSDASFMAPLSHAHSTGYGNMAADSYSSIKDESSRAPSRNGYRGSDMSATTSMAGFTGIGPPSTFRGGTGGSNAEPDVEAGLMTPSSEKSGEREYLNSPEELRFMQVFVSEVGVWMDSLDKEKHFSRMIPYHALKCPMLLNALLACGVKHLTLTQQYSDDKALFYYDTATTQLLRSLQNPERNTAECAATAVVLNVYEIMSEKPTQRMSHIAGARALIRECGWNAKSKGLGAACFWLNVGMELLSCLAFNWQTAWEPDQWGVDMDFSTEKDTGNEEIWVHRIFYVVAKIANFRASIPKFQEPSPHDEQVRLQARYAEWQRLKGMCDNWNNSCPRPMHPFGYLYPSQQTGANNSLFPNVWYVNCIALRVLSELGTRRLTIFKAHQARCYCWEVVLPHGAMPTCADQPSPSKRFRGGASSPAASRASGLRHSSAHRGPWCCQRLDPVPGYRGRNTDRHCRAAGGSNNSGEDRPRDRLEACRRHPEPQEDLGMGEDGTERARGAVLASGW